ncbi:hypothetical protein FB451DRAFT_1259514 [Mycena latifolia]|nr:hypothetical protein FB451DRAFT_1259514 [Mycena latifolia]
MQSPFTHHLYTNYVPPSEDIERIRADLISHVEQLKQIENAIRDLSAQRNEIEAYIESHRALISYPRRLPRDIIQEIFLACLPTDRNAVMSPKDAPMLLCRICSTWRDIALTTPALWASLHVAVQFIVGNEQRMLAVAEWLQRSAACPLSLSMVGDIWDIKWKSHPNDVTAVIELLAGHAKRWRNVELNRFSTEALMQLAAVNAPMLEAVDMSGTFIPGQKVELNLLKGKNLHSITVRAHMLDKLVSELFLASDQLTHLALPSGNISLDNAHLLLKRCPRLISVQLNLDNLNSQAQTAVESELSESISLPCIRTFMILGHYRLGPDTIERLLENVWMPELRRFRLPTVAFKITPNFLAKLGRKSPLIEHLEFYLATFTRDQLLEALEFFPSLIRLEVKGNCNWGSTLDVQQLLHLLTPGPETYPTALCPSLKKLVVKECHTSLSEAVLLSFLQSRLDEGIAFRRLEIEFGAAQDKLLDHIIEPFRLSGLKISLKFPRTPVPVAPTQWSGLSSRS